MKQSVASLNAMLDAYRVLLNGGTLKGYNGTQPASVATAIGAQTLLVTHNFPTPAFGAAANAQIVANAIANATIAASGTLSFFRAFDSAGNAVSDFSAATASADFIYGSTAFSAGAVDSITSMTVTQPGN